MGNLIDEATALEPSMWKAPSGKVHWRRLRFWPGQPHETPTEPRTRTLLCGSRVPVLPARSDETVDCEVCIASSRRGGHLPSTS